MTSTPAQTFTIHPLGLFSLKEAALFGFGQRGDTSFDGVMRLAFCADGHAYRHQVGVALRQSHDGTVTAEVHGDTDLDTVKQQVSRVLSLDKDGKAFASMADRDPVMAQLLAAAPGLRPVLFYSPYEAAAWCVLSARRPAAQMTEVRGRLSNEYGQVFHLAGQHLAAFPTPEQLLEVRTFPGINDLKLQRLYGVAEFALSGNLDCDRLVAMEPDAAMSHLQQIDGIGPFYSGLIVIRALGHADVLPTTEPRALALAGQLYGLGRDATPEEMRELAERWRPFRTWALVLLRAAASPLPSADSGDLRPAQHRPER